MAQTKKIKLSDNMKMVVKKMRTGLALGHIAGIGSIPDHIKIETDIKKVSKYTFQGLLVRKIIEQTGRNKSDKFYSLTELGKSIEL